MMETDLLTLFGGTPDLGILSDRPPETRGIMPVSLGAAPELCQLCDRWTPEAHPDDAIMDVKLDGHRALYLGGPLVSREGEPMDQAAHSHRALQELETAYGKPMFFDGEYVHPEGLDRCRRPGGTIWLFDAVPLDVWREGGRTAPLIERRRMLLDMGRSCFGPALGAVKPRLVRNAGEVEALRKDLEAAGYEGGVVKPAKGQYVRGRGGWWKVKHWRTVRCPIVDVLGRGDQARGLLVECQGKRNKITAGFSRLDLLLIWQNRNALVGSSAMVEHCGFTAGGLMRDTAYKGMANAG